MDDIDENSIMTDSPVSDSNDQNLGSESLSDGLQFKKKILQLVARIKRSKNLSDHIKHEESKDFQSKRNQKTVEDKVTRMHIPCNDVSLDAGESSYNLSQRKRGLAIFIINAHFDHQPFRPFANNDHQYMTKLFKHLGFETKLLHDMTGRELWKELIDIKASITTEYDCLVCVISSHGAEVPISRRLDPHRKLRQHIIFTRDGEIQTDRLLELFDNDHCPALTGKPKIFFIQACRCVMGADEKFDVDQGMEVEVTYTTVRNEMYPIVHLTRRYRTRTDDAIALGSMKTNASRQYIASNLQGSNIESSQPDTKGRPVDEFSSKQEKEYFSSKEPDSFCFIPCYEDFLVMFSSASERIAWSDRGKGGWLMYCLYKVFKRLLDSNFNMDLLNILSEVCGKMARLDAATPSKPSHHGTKSTATLYHMLTRTIYLQPKLRNTSSVRQQNVDDNIEFIDA